MRSFYAPLFLGLLAVPALAQNPRTSVQIDTALTAAVPSVASVGDLSAAVYKEDDASLGEMVYVTVSEDDGLTWSTPVRLDSDTGGANKLLESYSVQILGDHIYVAWADERHGTSNDEVYFAYSLDRGATWAPDQLIDKGYPVGTGAVREWSFTVTAGTTVDNVYFLISPDPTGGTNEELYALASDPVTPGLFLAPVYVPALAPQTADIDAIAIGAEGNHLYAVWVDGRGASPDDVWFQHSADRGQTWGLADVQVDDAADTTGDAEWGLSLSVSGSTVAVVWEEEKTSTTIEELRANVSTDSGVTWNGDRLVGNYAAGTDDVDNPRCTINAGDTIMAIWEDNRSGSDDIYVSTSNDFGVTWSADVMVSTAGGGYPRIAGGAAGAAVASWSSGSFPNFAETAYTLDDGVTWTTLQASDNTGDIDFAEMAFNAERENLVLVWLSDDLGTNHAYAGGYSICGPATVTHRNAGINVDVYTATTAVLGGTFTGTVDLSVTGHGLADLVGFNGSLSLTIGSGYTILVDVTDPNGDLLQFAPTGGTPAVFSAAVPNDPAFCGIEVYSQAVLFGGGPYALSNAQDLVLGAF